MLPLICLFFEELATAIENRIWKQLVYVKKSKNKIFTKTFFTSFQIITLILFQVYYVELDKEYKNMYHIGGHF